MTRALLTGLVGGLLLTSGCASNARNVKLASQASISAESHGMWTRPAEIGFAVGKEISASATTQKVLGFNVGESKPRGGFSVSAILSPANTGAAKLSATEEFAAYKAVAGAGVDGIYVTRIETDRSGFLFFSQRTTATVYGRAMKLKDYGPVSEDRADDWRFRGYRPDVVVIKDGKTDVNLPIEVND